MQIGEQNEILSHRKKDSTPYKNNIKVIKSGRYFPLLINDFLKYA